MDRVKYFRKICSRLDALRDDNNGRFLDTIEEILDRYLSLVAFAAVVKNTSNFPKQLAAAMENEGNWLLEEDVDPDVVSLFKALQEEIVNHRESKFHQN